MALGMDQPFLLHQNFDDFDDFCVNARIWDCIPSARVGQNSLIA